MKQMNTTLKDNMHKKEPSLLVSIAKIPDKHTKLFCNKKGFIASYMVDFYAYLVFVAIVVIFFVVLAFAASPVEKPLETSQASASLTTFLIRTLQTPIQINGKTTTPAEIISAKDLTHDKEFQKAVQESIETAYPAKKDLNAAWLRVYSIDEPSKENMCGWGIYGYKYSAFFFGERKSEKIEPVYTILNLPLKNKAEYVQVVLCSSAEYFK